MGSIVLLKSMSLDYFAVYAAGKYSIMGAAVSWVFGYLIGKVLEQSKTEREQKKHQRASEENKKKFAQNINSE